MPLKKILFLCLWILIFSCKGQHKQEVFIGSKVSIKSPVVTRNFKAHGAQPDFDTTLVSQYIRSIFQDSHGNIWFGTIGEGVVRYDVKTLTYFFDADGFKSNTVYAINEDKNGNLWFGTDQGVYKYNGKIFKNYNKKDGLNHIDITRKGILVDKKGNIWIGTHGGVYRYDPFAESIGSPSFLLFQPLSSLDVVDIFEDKIGNIWFATLEKGVFCYDGKTLTNIAKTEGLGINYAGGIAQDKSGNMWFSYKNGICKYDGKIFTKYTLEDGIGGTEVWGIYIDLSGKIWITARGATTLFDPTLPLTDPKVFTVYTPTEGINCCVQSMYQDKSGNMWWGTGAGLFRFDGNRFYQVKQNGPW